MTPFKVLSTTKLNFNKEAKIRLTFRHHNDREYDIISLATPCNQVSVYGTLLCKLTVATNSVTDHPSDNGVKYRLLNC